MTKADYSRSAGYSSNRNSVVAGPLHRTALSHWQLAGRDLWLLSCTMTKISYAGYLSLLKTLKDKESLEIFAPPP